MDAALLFVLLFLIAAKQTTEQARSIIQTDAVAQVNVPGKNGVQLAANIGGQLLFYEIENHLYSLNRLGFSNPFYFGNDQFRNFLFHSSHFIFSFVL